MVVLQPRPTTPAYTYMGWAGLGWADLEVVVDLDAHLKRLLEAARARPAQPPVSHHEG